MAGPGGSLFAGLGSVGVVAMETGALKTNLGGSRMQITIGFTCRECGSAQSILWDTAGSLRLKGELAAAVSLHCPSCGHISGELEPNYLFRESHRPSFERVP